MRLLTASLLLLLSSVLHAADDGKLAPAPPPPPLVEHPGDGAPAKEEAPASAAGDQELQPQVTIIKRKEETIEEYRVNGQLYMVKITPSKGYPYYLIDTNGDGRLDTRRNELDNPPVVQWRILTW